MGKRGSGISQTSGRFFLIKKGGQATSWRGTRSRKIRKRFYIRDQGRKKKVKGLF